MQFEDAGNASSEAVASWCRENSLLMVMHFKCSGGRNDLPSLWKDNYIDSTIDQIVADFTELFAALLARNSAPAEILRCFSSLGMGIVTRSACGVGSGLSS